jgi:hypothetical protein
VPKVALLLAVVAGLGGAAFVAKGAPTTWQAQQELRVATLTDTGDGMTSYQTDLITRGGLVPSFTAISDSRNATARAAEAAGVSDEQAKGSKVTMSVSRQGGGVLITATSPNREVAEKIVTAAGQLAAQDVANLRTPYYLQQPRRPVPEATHPALSAGLGLLVVAGVLPIVAFMFRRRRHRDLVLPFDDEAPEFDHPHPFDRVEEPV